MSNDNLDECCKKSFGESLFDTAKRLIADPSFAPQEIQTERLSICESCDQNSWGRCDLCGCVIDLKVKASNVRCPADKWLEYRNET